MKYIKAFDPYYCEEAFQMDCFHRPMAVADPGGGGGGMGYRFL